MDDELKWYKDIELFRAYMRGFIVIVFLACLWYVMKNYISPGMADVVGILDGMEYLNHEERLLAFKLIETASMNLIPSGSVWSWFTGVVTGTLIIYYFGEKASSKS